MTSDMIAEMEALKTSKPSWGDTHPIAYLDAVDDCLRIASKHTQTVQTKLPEAGYVTNLGLVFPARDLRDPDGIVRRGKPGFSMYECTSFTTLSTLYKIDFFLTIKVSGTPRGTVPCC